MRTDDEIKSKQQQAKRANKIEKDHEIKCLQEKNKRLEKQNERNAGELPTTVKSLFSMFL